MIFLSSEETRSVSDWPSAIECMRAVYAAAPEPGGTPGRVVATSGNGSLRCMPAIPPTGRLLGTKQLVKTREGRVSYLISLFDRASGELAFLVDGLSITAMRTAATTTAAFSLLDGRPEIDLAVLGSGLEATMHVEALATVRTIRSLAVFSPTKEKRDAFAHTWADALGIAASSCDSAAAAVAAASHVVAAARSHGERPILFGDWLADTAVVASIGSTLPSQREVDISVIERAELIVADDPAELVSQTGDMLAAHEAGVEFDSKLRSLHELAAQTTTLAAADCVRLFKSLGSGLQDVALAELLAFRCVETGLGTTLGVELAFK